jgi:hypothetical protein
VDVDIADVCAALDCSVVPIVECEQLPQSTSEAEFIDLVVVAEVERSSSVVASA